MRQHRGADVVVIGGGLAGATVAQALAPLGAKILIVDAGPQLSSTFGAHLSADPRLRFGTQARERLTAALLAPVPNGAATSHYGRPELPVALPAGGAGTLWTGIAERLDVVGTAARSFAAACLDPFYGEAEALLSVRPAGAVPTAGHGVFRPAQVACGGPRGSTTGPADILRACGPGMVQVLPGRLALRLEHRAGRIATVVVQDVQSGAVEAIGAGDVVVCADAIRSPALLAASGLMPEPGFPVGRWLADHPMAVARVEAATDAGRALARDIGTGAPGGIACAVWSGDPRPFHTVILATQAPGAAAATFHLFWYATAYPRPGNYLELLPNGAEPFASGTIRTMFTEPVADDLALTAMLEDLGATAGRLGRELKGWRPRMLPLGMAMHAFGTLRTGTTESVTDEAGRVLGFSNLFVAGASRLPCPSSVNPALAVVALAIGTARAISGSRHAPGACAATAGRTAPTARR